MATILIVDDDPECRRPLSTLLGHEGYRILQAGEGLEGLQRLRQEKVDLILLDMVMPGVDEGLRRSPEARSQEDPVSAEHQGSGQTPAICNAAGGDQK